jgi:RHS repeat-associated protein
MLAGVIGPLTNDTVTYYYDALGRMTKGAINGAAQMVNFDSLGRPTVVTNALGSFINVYFGNTDRAITNIYPNGQTAVFGYYGTNSDLRLQTIWNQSSAGGTISKFDYAYDPEGEITTWTQQADAATPAVWVTEQDPVDQLLGVTVRSNSIAGAILKQFMYAYDKAGNRTSETVQSSAGVPAAISGAGYNILNQMTNASGGGLMRFKGHLDELGTVSVGGNPAFVDSRTTNFVGYANVSAGTNVIPIVATDYSGNVRSNRYQVVVTNGAALSPQYDANGNMTNDGAGLTYEYDAANRTTAINRGTTNRTEFTYDGYGRRVQVVEKQSGLLVSKKTFLWCGGTLCEERDSSGATVTKRFFGRGEQVFGTNYFFTTDHLGSVREMTDGAGLIHARYDYDPYGRRTKLSGDMDADFGYTGHFMVASQPDHALTQYRLYRPDLGRWISRDPIGGGAANLYTYARNSPFRYVDNDGRQLFLAPVDAVARISLETGEVGAAGLRPVGPGLTPPLPITGPQPNPGPNPGPGPSPGPGPGPQPGPGPGPSPGPGPEPGPAPQPGPGPQPGPAPLPGPTPQPSPGPEPGQGPGDPDCLDQPRCKKIGETMGAPLKICWYHCSYPFGTWMGFIKVEPNSPCPDNPNIDDVQPFK